MRFVQGIVGFAVGFAIVLGLEIALVAVLSELFHARLLPRGLGWLLLPIGGGVLGWRFGYRVGIAGISVAVGDGLNRSSQNFRIWLVGAALWAAAVLVYVFVFEPYGSYWNNDDYTKFLTSLFGPILLGLIVVVSIPWVMK